MSSTTTMDAVRLWITAVTGLLTIDQNDDEPAAPRPNTNPAVDCYAMIGWTTDDSPMSTPYEETTDTEIGEVGNVAQYRALLRSRQLAVEVFGPGAEDFVFAIELSLGGPTYNEILGSLDIAVSKSGVVSDEPQLLSTTREPDATTTLTVGWTESEIAETNWVATVVPETDGVS